MPTRSFRGRRSFYSTGAGSATSFGRMSLAGSRVGRATGTRTAPAQTGTRVSSAGQAARPGVLGRGFPAPSVEFVPDWTEVVRFSCLTTSFRKTDARGVAQEPRRCKGVYTHAEDTSNDAGETLAFASSDRPELSDRSGLRALPSPRRCARRGSGPGHLIRPGHRHDHERASGHDGEHRRDDRLHRDRCEEDFLQAR